MEALTRNGVLNEGQGQREVLRRTENKTIYFYFSKNDIFILLCLSNQISFSKNIHLN